MHLRLADSQALSASLGALEGHVGGQRLAHHACASHLPCASSHAHASVDATMCMHSMQCMYILPACIQCNACASSHVHASTELMLQVDNEMPGMAAASSLRVAAGVWSGSSSHHTCTLPCACINRCTSQGVHMHPPMCASHASINVHQPRQVHCVCCRYIHTYAYPICITRYGAGATTATG